MTQEEGFFETFDREKLFYRIQTYPSASPPLLIVHGHGEHTGRYAKFFSRLENLCSAIAAFDLRGCGRSTGPRVYVSRFEDYLEDLSGFVEFLKKRYSIHTPVVLFGNSLGGLIATAWTQINADKVCKLILSSPLLGLPRDGALKVLVEVLDTFAPRWVIHNPVYPPHLTHDSREVEKYRQDPLIQRKITVRLVHEMLRYIHRLREQEIFFPFPVYVLMADQDFVVNPEATKLFFKRLRAPQKELEIFEGFYHEIFNELEQNKAFHKLKSCLG